MKILLMNDDGIHAPGLKALVEALKDHHDLYICAPHEGMSGMGHAITINKPMLVHTHDYEGAQMAYSIEGTPADCAKVALLTLYKDMDFDLAISGMNNGGNIGSEVIYSGTFAAAHEAYRAHLCAISVSLRNPHRVKDPNFTPAAQHFASFIKTLHMPEHAFFYNLNYPHQVTNFELVQTSVAEVKYSESTHIKKEGTDMWISYDGDPSDHADDPYTDFKMLERGYATLVTIQPEWTHFNQDPNTKKIKNAKDIC